MSLRIWLLLQVGLCMLLWSANLDRAMAQFNRIRVLDRIGRQGRPAGTAVEGEDLVATARVSAGRVVQQEMTPFGNAWSGNSQLFWGDPRPDARMEFVINVAAAGNYQLLGSLTKAPDYGKFQVIVNGTAGNSWDGFNPRGVIHSGPIDLGAFPLRAGNNQVVILITGGHPQSNGLQVGIDRLEWTPVGQHPLAGGRPMERPLETRPDLSSTNQSRVWESNMTELARDLQRLPNGADWRQKLSFDQLARIASAASKSRTPQDRQSLQEIYRQLDLIASDPLANELTGRKSFQRVLADVEQSLLPDGVQRASWASGMPQGALLYRDGGELYLLTDTSVKPGFPTALKFKWRVDSIPAATGILWQVSRLGFAPFDGGAASDFQPNGLVDAGYATGQQGDFSVNFGNYQNQLPPSGLAFRVRVLPLAAGAPNATKLAGQPSNEIGVYWGNLPSQPPFSEALPGGIPANNPQPPSAAPLKTQITLDYLRCDDANEYSPSDVSIDANVPPGDEPYLWATGFSARTSKGWNMTPIPMFKGVQDNGGHHGPCGVVFGEKGGFDDVYPGEKFGFHVVLMEWDESNAEERYEDLSKFAGLVGVGVATIATQGSTLSDPVAIKAAYDGGAKVGEMLPKIMASWDGDDFLGEQMVVLTYDSIAAEIQPWYERQMKAAKGGGQFLNQKGEPVSFIIKPWLDPQHQEMINLPGAVHFSEGGASYWLFYTVRLKNYLYTGPYQSK